MDQIKVNWRENARDGLLLLAFLGPLLLYLTGFLAGNTATAQAVVDIKGQLAGLVTVQDANRLKEQISSLASQVGQLQSDLRATPRTDQFISLSGSVAELKGYVGSIDKITRDQGEFISSLKARLDMIDQSSRAQLGKR